MKKLFSGTIFSWVVFGVIALAAYFINVEVQSYLGRQALERTGLVSVSLDEALSQASAENKQVLVDVSAIWCPTCRKLDNDVFADAAVRKYINENLVFTRLEYESDEGQAFLEKHHAGGFPTLWLLDGDGQVVRRLRVVFNPDDFVRQLR